MSSFNALLLDVSNGLSADQLDSLKFLCGDIGKRDREKCTTGIKLFQILTERNLLGPDNTEYLCGLLTQIQRPDLCAALHNFTGDGTLHTAQRDRLDEAAEVLSESLGRDWRRLGRKLGLREVRLEAVSRKNPTDLEETAVELVREWRRSKADQATVEVLLQALRDCDFNLTADSVEDRLGLSGHLTTI